MCKSWRHRVKCGRGQYVQKALLFLGRVFHARCCSASTHCAGLDGSNMALEVISSQHSRNAKAMFSSSYHWSSLNLKEGGLPANWRSSRLPCNPASFSP